MSKKFGIFVAAIAIIAVCVSSVTLVLTLMPKNQDEQSTQYVMYLGTNDKDTNKPVFDSEEAKSQAEKILVKHFGGYTIQEAHGGWEDEGKLYQEYTVVIYLSDTTLDKVHAAADEMIDTFRQSSVLIQANQTKTEFYGSDNE